MQKSDIDEIQKLAGKLNLTKQNIYDCITLFAVAKSRGIEFYQNGQKLSMRDIPNSNSEMPDFFNTLFR